jgi:hypothetical protein
MMTKILEWNAALYLQHRGSAIRSHTARTRPISHCELFVAPISYVVERTNKNNQCGEPDEIGGNGHQYRGVPSRADSVLKRIQIGAQFVAGHAGCSLDGQDAQRRNFVPLRDSLRGDADPFGEFGLSAGTLFRAIQG